MPSYKDLLQLLRKGKSPAQIVRALQMPPSHWRRMINGKRFQDALRLEETLAAVIATHGIASGVHGAADRFGELLVSDKPETSRKVALAILHEGLRKQRRKGEPPRSTPAVKVTLNPCNLAEVAKRTRQDWGTEEDREQDNDEKTAQS